MTKPATAIERLRYACKLGRKYNSSTLLDERYTAVRLVDVETMLSAFDDLAAILSAWSPYTSVDAERKAAMVAILDRLNAPDIAP